MRKLCSVLLVSVVRKVDSAIHWMAQLVSLILIRWIVIYPVNSAIQRLNNRGLESIIREMTVWIRP